MSTDQEKLENKIQEARLQYIKSLPIKISEINSIWNQLNNNESRIEIILKMRNIVHNLAASGNTFGFHELSEQAKILEHELDSLKIHNDTALDEIIKADISEILISLQEIELRTLQSYPTAHAPITKTSIIYILDAANDESLGLSKYLMYFGCGVKIINSIDMLNKDYMSYTPMLIILDADFAELKLNDHSVIDLLRKEWHLTCPIIYISDRDTFADRAKAMQATASAYFSKPIDTSLLLERINILTNAKIVDPYKVLLLDDNLDSGNLYTFMMHKHGIKLFVETNPEQILNRILELNPELIIINLHTTDYSSIEIIKIIRQHQLLLTLPIILLTSQHDTATQLLTRSLGVDDILYKPISDELLLNVILHRAQISRYMSLSNTKDNLTGLFINQKITEYLKIYLEICERYNTPLSYVIIDIDNLKTINDTYGHSVGERVLIAFAIFLKNGIRVTDFVGRYSSGEFVIICPETSAKEAHNSIERLRENFSKLNYYTNDRVPFNVTFSAGIASFPKYEDIDIMMAEADKALYKSKDNGCNQITVA